MIYRDSFSRVYIFSGLIFAGINFCGWTSLDISRVLIFAVAALAAIPANRQFSRMIKTPRKLIPAKINPFTVYGNLMVIYVYLHFFALTNFYSDIPLFQNVLPLSPTFYIRKIANLPNLIF